MNKKLLHGNPFLNILWQTKYRISQLHDLPNICEGSTFLHINMAGKQYINFDGNSSKHAHKITPMARYMYVLLLKSCTKDSLSSF